MILTRAQANEVMDSIAAFPMASPASPWKVGLFTNNIQPNADTVLADLTEASFTGYAKVTTTTGDSETQNDPLSGERVVYFPPPAGGFHFEATATPGAPVNVYGFFLCDNAGTTLLGAQHFGSPIVISGVGQAINIAEVGIRFPANFAS